MGKLNCVRLWLAEGAVALKHSVLRHCYRAAHDLGNDVEVGVYLSKAGGAEAAWQGLTLIHVRAQLKQLRTTFRS
jgi:hypothetical protein